jgi:parallel beta-helix repeat protein
VAVNNVSYGNGDHGVDLLSSPNNVLVSNTIYGNTTSGVTMETGSTGTTLRNNIIADNGTAQRGDIWADSTSTSGTTLDRDLVNQSGPGTLITWSGTKYGTISSFASATSDETHGLQGDPKWVNAAGGNFGLLAGSPAIDSADSSVPQETATDMLGVARFDDPGTTNTGVGPRTYDDRGALEFTGASSGPTEYVTNPGFETDLSGWAPNGKKPTLSRDGTEAHSGGFSALLSNLGTKPIACGLVDSPNWVTTSAAGTYTASMWIRSPVAGKVLTLTLNEANGTTALGSQSAHITLSTTWQQVTVQLTPTQPGTSTIGFTASVSKAPNGACFNADDISIQRA